MYYDSPDEHIVYIYCIIVDIGTISSTLLYLYVAYVLIKKSPSYMFHSKWMLLNTATSCFVYDLAIYIWKPVTIPHHSFFYSNGLLKNLSGYWSDICSGIAISAFSNLVHSLMLYMAYRYSCILPEGEGYFLSTRKQLITFGISTWLLSTIAPIVFAVTSTERQDEISSWIQQWNKDHLQKSILNDLYNNIPSFSSSDIGRNTASVIGAAMTLIGDLTSGIIVLSLNIKYYWMIKHGRGYSNLSERTKTLQWMLYKAQTVQLVFYLAFQIFPVVIVLFGDLAWVFHIQLFSLINGKMVILAFTSFHSFFDYFSILYFIRPYREFTFGWMRRIFRYFWHKDGRKESVFKVHTTQRVSSIVIESKDVRTL
ncbi:serpentine type 7TM GPCR chemoreceptor srh domain-containing protein [Ditylenchus destructor]|nr:serpentine type 7TM GPCR chemoreceptor srh domain-containing protein [Ditylenchus destructor]